MFIPLQWRYNERDDIWNYRSVDYLLNRLFRSRSNNTSKLRGTGLCEGPVTGEFPAQTASNAKIQFNDVMASIKSYN